jgi:hypothetical protein
MRSRYLTAWRAAPIRKGAPAFRHTRASRVSDEKDGGPFWAGASKYLAVDCPVVSDLASPSSDGPLLAAI